jgi:hypothetical protein
MLVGLNADPDTKFTMKVSYVEIYQNYLFDLLDKGKGRLTTTELYL